MKLLIDDAHIDDIKKVYEFFPVAGVTTNPTILRAEGKIVYLPHLQKIRALCGARSLHVQLGADTVEGMLAEADALREALGPDVYLKVPTTQTGLQAMKRLAARGANVTATAIYSPLQGMLAMAAGAKYLAPYCNRMEQNEIDFARAIAQMRRLIDRDGYAAKIVAASFKNAGQIVKAVDSGAHAVTAPPALLNSALRSALVTSAVDAFNADQAWVKGEEK